jgi:asparagine synthase (glutamine-hydrolysing)
MFTGIEALPPGFSLTCDADGVRTAPYWDLSFAEQRDAVDEERVAEELRERLRECIDAHLVSDVPFGAFLSGGVDSSTVVALMSQILEQPVKTFSVGFEGPGAEYSELPYARLVARRYATDHHEVLVRPEHLVELAEKVVWHLDQPIADEAALANYMVAELAAQHVKMVLTGEGGDELFAGYARYSWERASPGFRPLPTAARSALLAGARRLPGLRRPKIALSALLQEDETRRLASWFPLFNEELKAELLTQGLRRRVNGDGATASFARQLARTDAKDVLSRMLYVDTKLWLPDDLLARGDKTAMAASLEARVPLLDHTLVEFAATLPSNLKVHRLTRKYILKKATAPWLPPEILRRKKQGFPMPVSIWFRNEAKPFLRDILAPAALERRGLFRPELVGTLLDEHERGAADHGSLLWGLLSVELWHRLFIDAAPARKAMLSR